MAVKSLMGAVLALSLVAQVFGHGYMTYPAARNSAWRFGFPTPTNYDDNGIRCGGVPQNKFEDGKCGVCGDHYKAGNPEYVHPGKYAKGVITRTFTEGQIFAAKVMITKNHKGFFEFRVGKIGTPPMTNAKLTHRLELANGGTKWPLPDGKKEFSLELKLPKGLVCDHCVMQWWWKDGNSWGCDASGSCGMGVGLQEVFVNCADIRILPIHGTLPPTGPPSTQQPATQTPAPPIQPPVTSPPGGCKATGAWAGNTVMDQWCVSNCAVGNCPASMCVC